jgi:putative intracellular protease/amidase
MKMYRRWITAVCAAAALFVPAGAVLAGGAVAWKSDFAGAKAAAKKSHKLLFVDFYADW